MQVSVETLKGLERKVTITVPSTKVEDEVTLRLKDLSGKVKVDGFRPGKVPFHLVKSRYSDNVREEVARELVQSTLSEALQEEKLVPAGYPTIEPKQIEKGKDFIYSAIFEIFPEIIVKELENAKVETIRSDVNEDDVNNMIEKLREQNKTWEEVERPVANNDKVIFDFQGMLGDVPFEGGSAENHELIIGSATMIPGFEEGLIGGEKDKPFDIKVTFPSDYNHKELAGKEATFKISIKKVLEGKFPELDDHFAEKFNIKEGGIDSLKKDIKENMVRELERRVSATNREKLFDALLAINPFDLPAALIDKEIEHLKHEMYHRVFGNEHSDNEKIPDFPRNLFEESAKRRVHLGLLFAEYVKKHQMKVEKERVDATIEKFASAYEDPQELREWYQGSEERLAEVEALVMEEMVAEKIAENAELIEKQMKYDEVMNPKKDSKDKGE